MVKKGNDMSKNMYEETGRYWKDAQRVTTGVLPQDNKDLQAKYDEMHQQGPSSWFDDGKLERELILKMGEPWEDLSVLEIGCGEGDLLKMMHKKTLGIQGIDYSKSAIDTAREKHPELVFYYGDYKELYELGFGSVDVIVMQGVLEHLDDPFGELKWMIDNFKPKTIITSSPCFWNTRGIIWHTLDMLGAVMSKTDLHYLTPSDFRNFCAKYNYKITVSDIDQDWSEGDKMISDLKQRIPLALKDGNILFKRAKLDKFINWLDDKPGALEWGAVACYRIDITDS